MAIKPKKNAGGNDQSISLNKYISDTGFCSRREADKYIDHGRVTINDNVAIPGNRVFPGDIIEVDGESIGKKKSSVYLAYNKPVGITCTTDTKDKTNIIDAIGFPQRIFPIGRLDKESEGLIFLTNDGDIVNKILRAGNEHEKEYIVTCDKPISYEFVQAMASGVRILNETTLPCKVVQEGRSTFRITLIQGLNRQIRRMCEALDFSVKMLKRVRIMNVHLGPLKVGQWRSLNPDEVMVMMRMVRDSESSAVKAPQDGGIKLKGASTPKAPQQVNKQERPKTIETKGGAAKPKSVPVPGDRAAKAASPAKAGGSGKRTYKDYRKGASKGK